MTAPRCRAASTALASTTAALVVDDLIWFDVLIVVLPFLRPLRVVRSARLLRALRGARVLSFGVRFLHSTRALLDSRGLKYVLLAGSLLFLAAAVLTLLFEQGGGGNIGSLGDALWWAATTITTVGYGDKFPVTTEGRAVAVFLMLLGISLLSLVTASIAAFFVRPDEAPKASLDDVIERLDRLERLVGSLQPRVGAGSQAEAEATAANREQAG